MAINHQNSSHLYDYINDNDFVSEYVCAEICNELPLTTDNLEMIVKKHSDLIQLVNYLFNNLLHFFPENIMFLVFDRKGTLIETFQKGNCQELLKKKSFRKGSIWSSTHSNNPVGVSLVSHKITISDFSICEENDTKWTMVTVPIITKNPTGLISMVLPNDQLSQKNIHGFKFFCDFITMSLSNFSSLAESEKFFEQMFGNLAHEIKNSLTTIRGFVQLLAKNEGDPEKISYSNFILGELDRAHGILKNSIFYSSTREQRVNLCRISDIINEVLGSLHAVIANSKISLVLEIDTDIPHITGDRTQFRQVFLNIIQNAIEAMPNGGTLKISCKLINLQLHTVISDTGVGLPANIRDKIFQPFFSTKHGGTGLGLSVSRQVIEQYKGQIFVKSEKNTGTSFTIILPI